MVIDTSAILALLLLEDEAHEIAAAIADDPVRLISAATLLESAIVIESRHGVDGAEKLDRLAEAGGFQVEPVTEKQVRLARLAYRQYGKGRHPASLNFGDCFAYALAKSTGQPLLFKGNDFSKTDLQPVLDV
jgi:ribonuclease VapC